MRFITPSNMCEVSTTATTRRRKGILKAARHSSSDFSDDSSSNSITLSISDDTSISSRIGSEASDSSSVILYDRQVGRQGDNVALVLFRHAEGNRGTAYHSVTGKASPERHGSLRSIAFAPAVAAPTNSFAFHLVSVHAARLTLSRPSIFSKLAELLRKANRLWVDFCFFRERGNVEMREQL